MKNRNIFLIGLSETSGTIYNLWFNPGLMFLSIKCGHLYNTTLKSGHLIGGLASRDIE